MATRIGTPAADRLTGTPAEDTLEGIEGNDTLFGLGSVDRLMGGAGDDWLDGGVGNDIMVGGIGDDTYIVEKLFDRTFELVGEGHDTVIVYINNHQMQANIEVLIMGGSAGYRAIGNSAANQMVGNNGANTLDGAGGADTLIGGAGNDIYVVNEAGDVVIEANAKGTDTVQSFINWTLGTDFENLTLMGSARQGTGNAQSNALTGNAAGNRLEGLEGNDVLEGGGGADSLIGGAGNDVYGVERGDDVILENPGEGIDTVRTGCDWTLTAEFENLVLLHSTAHGGGNQTNNTILGNNARNVLHGLGGNDWLDGGASYDTLDGGAGDDTYVIDHFADVVLEAANGGTDTLRSTVSHVLGPHTEHLLLLGTASLNGAGNAHDNTLTGNGANNTLSGLGGMDALNGQGGNDLLVVGDASFTLAEGGAGIDVLRLMGAGQNLDLTDAPGADRVGGIEIFDLAGQGGVLTLNASAVLARGIPETGGVAVLWVTGGNGDRVSLAETSWALTATLVQTSASFDCYSTGLAEVRIQSGITVEIPLVGLPPT